VVRAYEGVFGEDVVHDAAVLGDALNAQGLHGAIGRKGHIFLGLERCMVEGAMRESPFPPSDDLIKRHTMQAGTRQCASSKWKEIEILMLALHARRIIKIKRI
jgi:hypothetical protein